MSFTHNVKSKTGIKKLHTIRIPENISLLPAEIIYKFSMFGFNFISPGAAEVKGFVPLRKPLTVYKLNKD